MFWVDVYITINCSAECRVLICDFHREQAWERWTKKSDSEVGEGRAEILALMRGVAKAETEEEYVSALHRLHSSAPWQENPKLRKYFSNVWLAQKEVLINFAITD